MSWVVLTQEVRAVSGEERSRLARESERAVESSSDEHALRYVKEVLVRGGLQERDVSKGIIVHKLNLNPGHCIRIKGFVPKDANCFTINLGKDGSNYVLHFNPRFDYQGDINTIVCNSKEADEWGTEQRESTFPFHQGENTEVCISYQHNEFIVELPGKYKFRFPKRLNVEAINYMEVSDLQTQGIKID
ncbi:galectin-1-like [Rhinatrema bivittatum]|uniref:galectin-1-like n=1 Tax=Rhinatrema bivittatum TaxID=194408 RepID=UPI0011276D8B|nr:galectin-1-like [Rhinatrema bivittatum]